MSYGCANCCCVWMNTSFIHRYCPVYESKPSSWKYQILKGIQYQMNTCISLWTTTCIIEKKYSKTLILLNFQDLVFKPTIWSCEEKNACIYGWNVMISYLKKNSTSMSVVLSKINSWWYLQVFFPTWTKSKRMSYFVQVKTNIFICLICMPFASFKQVWFCGLCFASWHQTCFMLHWYQMQTNSKASPLRYSCV